MGLGVVRWSTSWDILLRSAIAPSDSGIWLRVRRIRARNSKQKWRLVSTYMCCTLGRDVLLWSLGRSCKEGIPPLMKCVGYVSVAAMKFCDQKQVIEERVCSSLRFQRVDSVHNVGKAWQEAGRRQEAMHISSAHRKRE